MDKDQKVLFTIIIAAFVLRLFYLSPWLEDWDSVQFALGLHHFSIPDHQPHPPGYILYIFFGKILNLLLQNNTLSLTFLSALLGSLSAIPFYLLAKKILSKGALLTTAILLVTPIHWMLSELALTLIPGLFFTIITAYLLYQGIQSQKYLFIGSLLAGISIGVRFAEYSIVIPLLILVNLWNKNLHFALKSLLFFLFGNLIWVVPTLLITGPDEFVKAFINHSNYIISHDSIFSEVIPISRITKFLKLFTEAYSPLFLILLFFSIWQISKLFKNLKNFNLIFLATWLFSYLIPLLFIYNLELSRYILPLLPPIILLSFLTIQNFGYQRLINLFTIFLILILFFKSIILVNQLKSQIPPTISPVLFVKENFDPQKTTLITTYIFRQFQYYAPEFANFYGVDNSPQEISTYFVITDYSPLHQQITQLSKYDIYDQKKFSGPAEIFPRVPEVELTILKRR